MSRISLCVGVALLMSGVAAGRAASQRPETRKREVIVIYFGTQGTDSLTGMIDTLRKVRVALQHQAATSGQTVTMRGVSLEPSVEGGFRHLAGAGVFDEVSVGGNWTNSAVVQYLGGDMTNHERAAIPQVVVIERDVRQDPPEGLWVGAEHEIGRYVGLREINTWLGHGAPLPR